MIFKKMLEKEVCFYFSNAFRIEKGMWFSSFMKKDLMKDS